MLWALDATVTATSEWHRHDVIEFGLCLGDGGRVCGDAGEVVFAPGVSFLVPAGARHRFEIADGAAARLKLVCLVPGEMARHLAPAVIDGLAAVTAVQGGAGDLARLAAIADCVIDGVRMTEAGARLVDWAAVGLLLSLHLAAARLQPARTPERRDARMRAVADWLDGHLDAPLSLDAVASRFGLSRSLLTREFRRYAGVSLIDYRNRRRLERAALMLAAGEGGVTEVGLAAGFGNASHFHHQFKALYGLSPAAFRRKLREDGGVVQ